MFEIRKGVEIPKSKRTVPASRRKYNFEAMEVGDMIFVPSDSAKNSLSSYVSTVGKKLGRRFVTRRVEEDGVPGIGIWRVE